MKNTKPQNQPQATPTSRSSSVSSHIAMVELKQRILTSLSKLSDRDTHQIAVEDLEKTIQTLSPDAIPMMLNCLYDAAADPKPPVKNESLRLLAVVCASHQHSAAPHLTKIISHVVRRLKDPDSASRDACRNAVGSLSALYLRGEPNGDGVSGAGVGSLVGVFVKPLFEAMGEQNKVVQAGAAICMAKMVESAAAGNAAAVLAPVAAFQKLCPRICKLLNNPNFLAKAAILPVVAGLSQAGAIAPQSLDHLLPSIHDCLSSTDWATRKAAAEALSSLALHSSSLITDKTAPTLAVHEACRFDKIIVQLLDYNCKDSMGTEFEAIAGRITSMLSQLQSEYGILERMVYKNKNQHRRCSYFQRLLKVRRDLRLLQSANLEELVTSCFLVIKGDRPKQKVYLLESLKRRKCNNEKHNFLECLLGAARLLAEMVEPILKAATEVSVLFARSFFMGFSLTIMALLARLRVLVQQILLDVVSLFNMVSSLSKEKQSIKITHEGIEVFREFYPVRDDYVTLECVWESDKYILLERKHKRENESQGEDSSGNLSVQASGVKYNTIKSFLGDDQLVPERMEVDAAAKEDPSHVKDMNTDLLTGSSHDDGKDIVCSEEGGENHGTTKASSESLPEGGLYALSRSSTSSKLHSSSKKVAFVSIKDPTSAPQSVQSSISVLTSNAKAFHFMGNESDQTKDEMGDSLASLLTNVNARDSLF